MHLAAWLYDGSVSTAKGQGEPEEWLGCKVRVEPWLTTGAKPQATSEIGDALTARGGRREEKWMPTMNARHSSHEKGG